MEFNYDLHVVKSIMDGYELGEYSEKVVVEKLRPIYNKLILEEVLEKGKVLEVLIENDIVSHEYVNQVQIEMKNRMRYIK